MSLQVWMPLNGDMKNLGIGNVTYTSSSELTFVDGGKMGKCLSDEKKSLTLTCPELHCDEFSVGMWVYFSPDTTSSQEIMRCYFNKVEEDSKYYIMISIDKDKKLGFVYFNQEMMSGGMFTFDESLIGTWVYCVFTGNKDSYYKVYFNGKRRYFGDDIISSSEEEREFIGKIGISDAWLDSGSKISNLTIYDRCLSPKEVHEISQGLLVHYPMRQLDRLPKLSYTNFSEWKINSPWGLSNSTIRASRTGATSYVWSRVQSSRIPIADCSNGVSVFFEFKVDDMDAWDHKCICSTQGYTASNSRNNWTETQISATNSARYTIFDPFTSQTWIRCIARFTKTECKGKAPGTDEIVEQTINFNLVKNGSISVKNPMIVKGLFYDWIDWISDETLTNREYDCSGYGYDATMLDKNVSNEISDTYKDSYTENDLQIEYYGDATVHNGTYYRFRPYNTLYVDTLPFASLTNCTIAFWGRIVKAGGNYTWFLRDKSALNYIMTYSMSTLSNSQDSGITAYSDGEVIQFPKSYYDVENWHHYCFTGVDLSDWTGMYIHPSYYDHGSYAFSPDAESTVDMSDLRIYNTALSADAVKKLSSSPISIAKSGDLITYGEIREGDSANPSFGKSGVIKNKTYEEGSSTCKVYKTGKLLCNNIIEC